jgi:hypothetical protein
VEQRFRSKRLIDPDPFVMGLFGGLPRTETCASATSTDATTVLESRSELAISSLAPETRLSCEQSRVTQRSRGATRNIAGTTKKASSATSFGTRVRTSRRSLSDRLTLSLISAGLVKGITPSLTRKRSGQPILVLALDTPVGNVAAKPLAASSSLKG